MRGGKHFTILVNNEDQEDEKHNERIEKERGEEEKIIRSRRGCEKGKEKEYTKQQETEQGKPQEEKKMEESVEENK